MKAFLIDPFARSITEVDFDGNYKSIYPFIGADLFTGAYPWENGDMIYVDDEGLFKSDQAFFVANGYGPLAGKGLVLGTGANGDNAEPLTALADLNVDWVVIDSTAPQGWVVAGGAQ
ncbi:hypothetical protein UFOVP28_16 [uncultured Caudovirales phage]|uniref:DUF3846 domain-containing protein n=1 Tax=uncultured Caudovirales phage TaxID=2100421 RepID=A0A6J5KMY3_9CAUD|nr:hypothetical protein UFOVP28_16 [uncultured Caudovirales phage]